MRHALSAVVLLLPLLAPAAGRTAEPGLHSFTLDNGLAVVVIEDHRAPAVTQTLWYRVGSADDPAGQAGTAHFLEHLMFKATDKLAEGEFDRTVEENGGSFSAFTTIDHTAFTVRVAADRLDLMMGMEADRMAHLAPSEASVLSERAVVIEERRQVVDGDPGGAFNEQLLPALYHGSPRARPTIGPEAEIAGLTRDTAMAFYRAHYAPNNATLVVAGDVDTETVRQLAERHFGPIPPAPLPPRPDMAATPPAQPGPPIVVHDARVAVAQLSRLHLAPPRRPGDQQQAAALIVLADLLGGQRVTSLMSRDLVGADGIALAAGASYGDTGLGPQSFGLYLVPKPGVAPVEAEAALDALVARFLEQGPDPAEIERIKGRIRAMDVYKLDDVSGRASDVAEALTSGLTLYDIKAWPDVLAAVTVEDVRAAAAEVLDKDGSVSGWLLPPDATLGEPQP